MKNKSDRPQPTAAKSLAKKDIASLVDAGKDIAAALGRIANALERLDPVTPARPALAKPHETKTLPARQPKMLASVLPGPYHAYHWEPDTGLRGLAHVDALPLSVLRDINSQTQALLDNTKRFCAGKPAQDVLLWGARGMGKSSLIKAVCHHLNEARPHTIILVEVTRDHIAHLPHLMDLLAEYKNHFIIFCDDLSFESLDHNYKQLKSTLEGGLRSRPANILVYATSNRRHLVNQRYDEATLLHSDQVDESISLADRFGLWLGFHGCNQNAFEDMVQAHAQHNNLAKKHAKTLISQANTFARQRGGRSGRIAKQFVEQLARRPVR